MKYATAQRWHIYCLKQLKFVALDWILIINIIIIANYYYDYDYLTTSQMVLVVKNPPASAGDIRDTGSITGVGRFPATHSSVLAWIIPWIAGWLQTIGHQVSDMTEVT